MKTKIYWRTLSPWVVVPVAVIAVPFIALYMWIRHPRRCVNAWRQSKNIW